MTLQTSEIRWPPLPSLPSTIMAQIRQMMTLTMAGPQDPLNLVPPGKIMVSFCLEGFSEDFCLKQRLCFKMSNLKYQTLFTSVAESLPTPGARLTSTALGNAIVAAPVVELNASLDTRRHLDPSATEVKYNPRYVYSC